MRAAILDGSHWFDALLDAVTDWRAPEEWVGERHYRYLIGGEAFDWLLLAERLLDCAVDLVPRDEREALLFENRWPADVEMDDDTFAERLGQAKHSAHLNYLYGVLVEEALQLGVEEELHKENRSGAWGRYPQVDDTMFERVYGKPRLEMLATYYEETGVLLRGEVGLADWRAFTYWCFKFRMRRQDKARVASDTRKGLAQLTRMEALAGTRRRSGLSEEVFAARFVT